MKNLKILWENLDDYKHNNENNKNKYLINSELLKRYKQDFELCVYPTFAKLPSQDYDLEIPSTIFNMAYNEEKRKKHTSLNVNLF